MFVRSHRSIVRPFLRNAVKKQEVPRLQFDQFRLFSKDNDKVEFNSNGKIPDPLNTQESAQQQANSQNDDFHQSLGAVPLEKMAVPRTNEEEGQKSNTQSGSSAFNWLLSLIAITGAVVIPTAGFFYFYDTDSKYLNELCSRTDKFFFRQNNISLFKKPLLLKFENDPKLNENDDIPATHFTIVIDMNDLIYMNPVTLAVSYRPYMDHFVKELSTFCEVIIWNGSDEPKMDPHYETLQHRFQQNIHQLLTYAECTLVFGQTTKDLTRLYRRNENLIHITSSPFHAVHQPDNAIPISKYFGSSDDTTLLEALAFLQGLCREHPQTTDIRKVIRGVRNLNFDVIDITRNSSDTEELIINGEPTTKYKVKYGSGEEAAAHKLNMQLFGPRQ